MLEEKDISGDDSSIDPSAITTSEIEEWIVTTRKVLIVLDGEDKSAYNKVYKDFVIDLQILKDAGRISDIDYEDILENT